MKFAISDSVTNMEGSKILDFLKKIEVMKSKGFDVIRLDIGDPDFRTPKKITDAACKLMNEGYTHYGPPLGIPELRTELARLSGVKTENVIITPGSKQAVFYALKTILNPGEEVILPIPGWLEYEGPIMLSGGKVIFSRCTQDFQPDIDDIKKKITKKTKAIILNSPNNPTGVVYSRENLRAISEIANDHGLFVISDEVYCRLVYGMQYPSISEFMRLEEGLIIVNSFSKTYAMTGWRLGYAIASPELIENFSKIQVHTVVAPTTFSQYAALVALRECEGDVKKMVAELDERRKFIMQSLSDANIEFIEPKGAFYFFIDLSKYFGKKANIADQLLEKIKIAVVSGEVFGPGFEGFIRLSYTTTLDRLEIGLKKIISSLH